MFLFILYLKFNILTLVSGQSKYFFAGEMIAWKKLANLVLESR